MAISKEQLRSLKAGERRYETERLPNGDVLRGRTLLRGERRRRRKFLQDNRGQLDRDKAAYVDDVFAAYHLCDDDGELILTPEEALDGFFDDWSDEYVDALLRLLRKLQDAEPGESERDELVASLEGMTDEGDMLDIAKRIAATFKNKETPVEDAVKNSNETPGSGSYGVSAVASASA